MYIHSKTATEPSRDKEAPHDCGDETSRIFLCYVVHSTLLLHCRQCGNNVASLILYTVLHPLTWKKSTREELLFSAVQPRFWVLRSPSEAKAKAERRGLPGRDVNLGQLGPQHPQLLSRTTEDSRDWPSAISVAGTSMFSGCRLFDNQGTCSADTGVMASVSLRENVFAQSWLTNHNSGYTKNQIQLSQPAKITV